VSNREYGDIWWASHWQKIVTTSLLQTMSIQSFKILTVLWNKRLKLRLQIFKEQLPGKKDGTDWDHWLARQRKPHSKRLLSLAKSKKIGRMRDHISWEVCHSLLFSSLWSIHFIQPLCLAFPVSFLCSASLLSSSLNNLSLSSSSCPLVLFYLLKYNKVVEELEALRTRETKLHTKVSGLQARIVSQRA